MSDPRNVELVIVAGAEKTDHIPSLSGFEKPTPGGGEHVDDKASSPEVTVAAVDASTVQDEAKVGAWSCDAVAAPLDGAKPPGVWAPQQLHWVPRRSIMRGP